MASLSPNWVLRPSSRSLRASSTALRSQTHVDLWVFLAANWCVPFDSRQFFLPRHPTLCSQKAGKWAIGTVARGGYRDFLLGFQLGMQGGTGKEQGALMR